MERNVKKLKNPPPQNSKLKYIKKKFFFFFLAGYVQGLCASLPSYKHTNLVNISSLNSRNPKRKSPAASQK